MVSIIFIWLFVPVGSVTYKSRKYVIENMAYKGPLVGQTSAESRIECGTHCLKTPGCTAYHYDSGSLDCQLLEGAAGVGNIMIYRKIRGY